MSDQLNLGLKIETPPPRPDKLDEVAVRAIAEAIVDAMCIDDNSDDAIESVEAVLTKEWDWDGYSLAKELEDRHGWSPNADDVDALSSADGYRRNRLATATAEWVKRFNVEPKYAIGDLVTVKQGYKPPQTGEITAIHREDAKYTVFLHDDHSNTLEESRKSGLGYIIAYENVIGITGVDDAQS